MSDIKILFINGSPNVDGNTAQLMRWVQESVEPKATTEWVNLCQYDLNYCQGCSICLKTGKCFQNDFITELKERIIEFDGIVLCSPVYEGHITAQLKTFLDRLALFSLYYGDFDAKWSLGIATSGIAPTKKTAVECTMVFPKLSGILHSQTVSMNKMEYCDFTRYEHSKLFSKASKCGLKLFSNIKETPSYNRGAIKTKWISFLRQNFLKRLVLKNKEMFSGVIKNWEEKGWL